MTRGELRTEAETPVTGSRFAWQPPLHYRLTATTVPKSPISLTSVAVGILGMSCNYQLQLHLQFFFGSVPAASRPEEPVEKSSTP